MAFVFGEYCSFINFVKIQFIYLVLFNSLFFFKLYLIPENIHSEFEISPALIKYFNNILKDIQKVLS